MTPNAPFTGELFDAMFAEAVYSVASSIARAGTTSQATELPKVRTVMLEYLAALQAGTVQAYRPDTPSPEIVTAVSNGSGVDYTSTEAILGEVSDETASGLIPAWLLNPAQVTLDYNRTRDAVAALRPPIIYRVAQTILDPITKAAAAAGIELPSLAGVVTFLKVLLFIAVLVGLAYAYRTFWKGKR